MCKPPARPRPMRDWGIVMTEPRSVVITGASRGLGLASATHLYNRGWRVVGAMRNPELGLDRIREACGASSSDARLLGVQLDLTNTESIESGAKAIEQAVGAPYALVHNAGITAVGCVEEVGIDVWHDLFTTNLFGPVTLTQALAALDAGSRHGSYRDHLQFRRGARYAGDLGVLGSRGCIRALGRIDGE